MVALGLLVVAALAWRVQAQGGGAPPPAAGAAAPADPAPRPAASGGAGRGGAPAPVVVAGVQSAEDRPVLEVVGTARAQRSALLYPAVAGEVAAVRFRAGQAVQAGQVLVQLVDRPQRLAVELAEARQAQAQALLARYERTRGTGAVPESLIDEAASALRLAGIELAQAREAVADRQVRAPFAGTVGLPGAEPGERVGTDKLLATVDDRRTLQVEFTLPEQHLPQLAPGQALEVASAALPGQVFAGRVAQIDSRVDAATRSLRLRADVPNRGDALRPGMSLQVRLALPGGTHLQVPELALQWDREGAFVWAVREQRSVRVPVRPVRRSAEQVLLDGDLQPGEAVVVEGVHALRAGRAVNVIGRLGG